jgi:hypothetical protein
MSDSGRPATSHLRYLRDDRQRKRSTVGDARSTIEVHLLPVLGASTPVEHITTADVNKVRDELLAGKLAHCTVQKVMILLHGVLGRAMRKGWIFANPCESVEKVSVRQVDEFNVLDVERIHAVAHVAGRVAWRAVPRRGVHWPAAG